MRLLIFGKTGQVASELCLQSADAGHEFTALSRDQVDVRDKASIKKAIAANPIDVIINATAYTNVDGAESEQELAAQINSHAPHNMARYAAEQNIPFIHISTDYVFRGDGGHPWKIDDPIDPINHYGISKAEGERLIATTAGRNIIMRTSWVFSNFGKNFVKTILRVGAANDELKIVGDQIGGPTSAADIASALLHIAQKECDLSKSGTQIIHYAGMPYISWAGFAESIVQKAGLDVVINAIPTSQYPTPANRPLNSRLDSSNLNALYGIKEPDWGVSLDNCLKRILINDQS